MKRVVYALLLGSALLAACVPTPTPTPRPPTLTPVPIVTIIASPRPRTLVPSWTPQPTFTPQDTPTRLPSLTPRRTATTIPSFTPAGGKPGILTAEGLLTVALNVEDIDAGLKEQRRSFYFSSEINTVAAERIEPRTVRMRINFNDFTQRGLPGEFILALRPFTGEMVVDIVSFQAQDNATLTARQIGLVREMGRLAFKENILPTAIRRIEPDMVAFEVRAVQFEAGRVLVTVHIQAATPTPGPSPTATLRP